MDKKITTRDRDCQMCEQRGNKVKATWDAKTLFGPWAYLCNEHMRTASHPGYREAATPIADEAVMPR